MKPQNKYSMQISDGVVFCLVPALSWLMPAAFSRKLIAILSKWNWLLARDAFECFEQASKYVEITNRREWEQRLRLVVMLEVRDLTLLSGGRRKAVFDEIAGAEKITQSQDRVLVGMHWGPSIALLSLLQSRNLEPLLVYRPVDPEIRNQRRWYYNFLIRSVRYIEKTCGDQRAITIKGAGDALRRELLKPGTSVVVLDAPPAPGRSTIEGSVLGLPVLFNAGFPGILGESGREYQFYAISLNEEGTLRKLELTPPRLPQSQRQLIDDYCSYLTDHINRDPAQWRIWQVAGQFFQDDNKTTQN